MSQECYVSRELRGQRLATVNWWSVRRNQLIAGQAVVVVVLCVAVYFGFLRPGAPGSLNGVTAPGGSHGPPQASLARHGHHRTGHARRHGGRARGIGAGSRARVAVGAGPAVAGGAGPSVLGSATNPSLPSGSQYASAVTALAAKVGPTPAAGP